MNRSHKVPAGAADGPGGTVSPRRDGGGSTCARFRVAAFYTAREDAAHISFGEEAVRWFDRMAAERGFAFEAHDDWSHMTPQLLARTDVVIFLDSRPDDTGQRDAFRRYMEAGGAWMGFHFAGFALTPSKYPQDWDWYHLDFLGSDSWAGNTWRPTPAILRVEEGAHPAMVGLPPTFRAAANEWYRWTINPRTSPDIHVLASIDPTSFPLGTGPKAHEIWHSGDYPVVWTNTRYRMIYFNMGHNDMDYDVQPARTLSSSFESEEQNRMILNALEWLATE